MTQAETSRDEPGPGGGRTAWLSVALAALLLDRQSVIETLRS